MVWQACFDWIKKTETVLISDQRSVIQSIRTKKEDKVLDQPRTPAHHRLSHAVPKEVPGCATKRIGRCQLHLHPLPNPLPGHLLYPTIIGPLFAALLLEEI
jgi:hypothetical protein